VANGNKGRARPSIGDVAQLAGVSLGTVSNVLNHPSRVSPGTSDKVVRAMAMLDYVPDGVARSLAAGSSRTIGIVLPDLANSLFVDVARGAESAAESADHTLMIANSDTRLEREVRYLRTFGQARVAGILLTLNDEEHYAAIAGEAPRTAPTVMLNLAVPTARSCSVSVDNELGGRLATEHLADTGRRRLVFVGGPETLEPVRHRERGFARAVRERGLEHVRTVSPGGVNRADGWEVGGALVPEVRAGTVDGIVAATDLLAAGILQAFSTAGVDVPGTVGVVGYDNNQAAWDSPIPITTVAQPGAEMGRAGAELVLAEARGGSEHHHRAVVLEPSLVVRASTADPR
jgi:LacI family transcriptional regulator